MKELNFFMPTCVKDTNVYGRALTYMLRRSINHIIITLPSVKMIKLTSSSD